MRSLPLLPRSSFRATLGLATLALLSFGCSAGKEDDGTAKKDGGTVDTGSIVIPDGDPLEVGGGDASFTPVATLKGKVLAPEGTIPISGALVYVAFSPPASIPDGVYCDECVKLESGTPYTFSNADGTFALPVPTLGQQYLIVQKGQFRRYRQINVTAGDFPVPAVNTTFPKKIDAANGDSIPKMALVNGAWDKIELSLAGLGLGTVVNGGGLAGKYVDKTTAPYDFYYGDPIALDPSSKGSKGSYTKILNDYSVLSKYHIVFLPCSWSDSTTCYTSQPSTNSTVKQNLINFVKAGGKLYATDYSYEFVRQIFPGYVDWQQQTTAVGSACLTGAWSSPATSPDKGLTDWLAAQSITSFNVEQNWTALKGVHTQATVDQKGNPISETPKIWVNATSTGYGTIPTTVSFQQQCGRVLYSTYHTEGTSAGLLPQERALLYILLEVGVCLGQVQIQ
jgi:hypothetical protein